MSWFSEAIKRNTPKKNPITNAAEQLGGGANKTLSILLGNNTGGGGLQGLFDSNNIGGMIQAGLGNVNPLLSKGMNTLFDINEEGSGLGKIRGFGSNLESMLKENYISKQLSDGWATQSDRLIPDKYQDIIKGQPNLGKPNIPQPGHGAFEYLNERTRQLAYVENKLYNFRDWFEEKTGFGQMLGLAKGKDKGGGGGTGDSTKPPPQRVKGPGTLEGKAAKFVMNKSGAKSGRSSLKISRRGRGGGSSSGATSYKWKTNM